MKRTAWLVLFLISREARAETGELVTLIRENCVRCHDGTETFPDFRELSTDAELETWRDIKEKVATFEMPPPPEKTASVAERFPLDPQRRARLLALVDELIEERQPAEAPLARHLSHRDWSAIVEDFAKRSEQDVVVPRVANDKRGPYLRNVPPRDLPPVYLALIRNTAAQVCMNVAASELAQPASARHYLAEFRDGPNGAIELRSEGIEKTISVLFTGIYGDASEALSQDGARALMTSHRELGTWIDAWVAVCVAHLSGPRILYESQL